MKIIKHKNPFPHVVIDNFYSEQELFHIWKELDFLTYVQKLESPEDTSSAKTKEGVFKKNNYAIYLDNLYKNREISNILTITRKLFDDSLMEEIYSFDMLFKGFEMCNSDLTLLSYYENSQYYKSHKDSCSFTSLTWFYKNPKKFKGGDLYFPEYDYLFEIKNNKLLFFPSFIEHQVVDVVMENYKHDEYGMLSGKGRYCLSQFCGITYYT